MAEIERPNKFSFLESISSIDGRFRGRVEEVSSYFSEHATIHGRVFVEIEYLIALLDETGSPLTEAQKNRARKISIEFDSKDAMAVWKIDEKINHDTKAVEIFLQDKFDKAGLGKYKNYIHLGLTSTDVDNTSFAISLSEFKQDVMIPSLTTLTKTISSLANEQANLPMLARTHGQPAVPTTAGKEFANYADRLTTQTKKLEELAVGSKISGAVGNHNALVAAYPGVNWVRFSEKFLRKLGLEAYSMSTQVEPYEHKTEFMQAVQRINTIVQALSEDIWRYLALGYLSLRDDSGHVGSSTMPQKINPIGFELAESYLLLSNGIFQTMIDRLPTNRLQRDLTDKYLLRDIGQALAMSLLAYHSANEALSKIGFNEDYLKKDLENHWEVIGEGVQTILRTIGYKDPYEVIKKLSRGKSVTKEDFLIFIEELEVDENVKKKLRNLSPLTYTGNAETLASYDPHARKKRK